MVTTVDGCNTKIATCGDSKSKILLLLYVCTFTEKIIIDYSSIINNLVLHALYH